MAGMLNSTEGRGLADGGPVCPMPPPAPAGTQSLCLGEREAGIHFWTLKEKEGGEGRDWKSWEWMCSILLREGVELGDKE